MIYGFFDTETTGLKNTDKVISFGSLFVEVDEVAKTVEFISALEVFNMVNQRISTEAIRVHGITEKKLKELSGGKKAYENTALIEECLTIPDVILAYNEPYDTRMIKGTYPSIKMHLINKKIDILKVVTEHIGTRIKLEDICRRMFKEGELEQDFREKILTDSKCSAHSAAYDSYACARVYFKLLGYEWI